MIELDRYQEALAAFDRALSLKPVALAYTNMAYVLADLGRLDELMKAVRKAIELDPGFTGNYFMVAEAKRFSPGDPDLAAMETHTRAQTCFRRMIACCLILLSAKPTAILKTIAGRSNICSRPMPPKRSIIKYNEAAEVERFDHIERVFSRDLFAAKTGLGDPSRRPIFVLGMPRSGSTLIEQILVGATPDVESAGELLDRKLFAAIKPRFLTLSLWR